MHHHASDIAAAGIGAGFSLFAYSMDWISAASFGVELVHGLGMGVAGAIGGWLTKLAIEKLTKKNNNNPT